MEMEFKDTGRRRRFVLILVGVALALAAGFGAFSLASKSGPAVEVVKKSVLVAARDIPARTQVSTDDLTLRQVPIDEALSQSYGANTDVVGRVTSVPIYTDQQITPNLFATSTADTDFSILGSDETVTTTSPEWRAVAIQIPNERAVGGEVKAGQHVDLVVSVDIKVLNQDADGNYVDCGTTTPSQFQCGKATKITFQDVEVLKATPDDEMYVFKVDLHQAEQISHVIQEAPDSFTMVLRPDEDNRPVDESQYGTTTDRLIMTYLYPAPQLIDLNQLTGPSPYPYPGAPNGSFAPGGAGSGEPGASPAPSTSPGPGESPSPDQSPGASAEPSPTP
jgi:Flp pilus assembly protein CpaB